MQQGAAATSKPLLSSKKDRKRLPVQGAAFLCKRNDLKFPVAEYFAVIRTGNEGLRQELFPVSAHLYPMNDPADHGSQPGQRTNEWYNAQAVQDTIGKPYIID